MTAQSEGHLRDNKKVIFHPDDTLQIKANSYILFVMPSESKVQYGKKTCIWYPIESFEKIRRGGSRP